MRKMKAQRRSTDPIVGMALMSEARRTRMPGKKRAIRKIRSSRARPSSHPTLPPLLTWIASEELNCGHVGETGCDIWGEKGGVGELKT